MSLRGDDEMRAWWCNCFRVVLVMGCLAVPPVGAENLIPNPSFEGGVDSHFAIGRWYVNGLSEVVEDESTAAHGRFSARLSMSRLGTEGKDGDIHGIAFRSADAIHLEPGNYVFSVYLKGDRSYRAGIVISDQALTQSRPQRTLAQDSVRILSRWRRSRVRFTVPVEGDIYWKINVQADRPGHVWVDALQLETGRRASEFSAARALTGGVVTDKTGSIYDTLADKSLVVRLFNNSSIRLDNAPVTLVLRKASGGEVFRETRRYSLDPRTGTTVHWPFDLVRNGSFLAELLDSGGGRLSKAAFSILRQPREMPGSERVFGAYITPMERPLGIMKRAGFGWVGSLTASNYMVGWDSVEKRRGRYQWHDAEVDRVRDFGFEYMFNLEPCRTPSWARELDRDSRRQAWSRYASAMARHYGDRVKYWAIADEVDELGKRARSTNCWATAAEYYPWHTAGYHAIRAAAPDARVILNGSAGMVEQVLALDGGRTTDILAGNFYQLPAHMRSLVALASASGMPPVWAPGVAAANDSVYLDRADRFRSAEWRAVDALLEDLAMGVRPILHYTASYVGNTNRTSLFEHDDALKPLAISFSGLSWLLDGLQQARPVKLETPDLNLSAYRFERSDGNIVYGLKYVGGARIRLVMPATPGQHISAYDHHGTPISIESEAGRWRLAPDDGMTVFLVVDRDDPALERAVARSRVEILDLPPARRVSYAGRYALLTGIIDRYTRRKPNISLWYRTEAGYWLEVLQNRTSDVLPRYVLTENGLEITWDFAAPRAHLLLSPGLLPATLVEAARFSRAGLGEAGGGSGVFSVDVQDFKVSKLGASRLNVGAGIGLYRFEAGPVTMELETRIFGETDLPAGGWRFHARKDLGEFFLQRNMKVERRQPVSVHTHVRIMPSPSAARSSDVE